MARPSKAAKQSASNSTSTTSASAGDNESLQHSFSSSPVQSSPMAKSTRRVGKSMLKTEKDTKHAGKERDEIAGKEFLVRAIIDENAKQYVVDWADSDGTEHKPTLEPKGNVNEAAVTDWEKTKAKRTNEADDGSVTEIEKITSHIKLGTKKYFKILWDDNADFKISWEPESNLPPESVREYFKSIRGTE